jgi:Tol biopolymer transport system component
MAIESGSDSESNIYVYDLHGSTALRRLTFGGRNRFPVWSADGRQVLFQSDRGGDAAIYSQAADGASTATRLTRPGAREMHAPEAVSPDGTTLLFSVQTPTGVSLATLSLRDGLIAPYGDAHSSIPLDARFSPDGRWVAYGIADRSGRQAIFVSSFPSAESKYELPSDASGTPHKPVWAADGGELIYVPRLGGFEAIAVTTAPSFSFGQPASIPRSFNPGAPSVRALFDVTPQGGYVGVLPVGDSAPIYSARQVHVVLNWLAEVERLVPRQ